MMPASSACDVSANIFRGLAVSRTGLRNAVKQIGRKIGFPHR
jgi:hypothetical protein